MKHYTCEELQKFVTGILKTENPNLKPNAKNIGLWLKKNEYSQAVERQRIPNKKKLQFWHNSR